MRERAHDQEDDQYDYQADITSDAARSPAVRASSVPGGKRLLRVVRKRLHPVAQLCRMNLQVFGGLRIRHPAILDQPHRLKLELSRKSSLSMTHLQSHKNT